jgi:ribonuclease BN (tRNA processing enzyme)
MVTAARPASPALLDVTVLGSSSSIPRPGRACSAYLVQGTGRSVALDLGSGAFSNLLEWVRAEDVDAVVISHMHPDHFLDIIPMRYALRYGPRTHARRPVLYLPPDGEALLRRLVNAFVVESNGDFLDVYDVRTYDPARGLQLGDLRLRFALTMHYIPAFAVRCEVNGRSVTYSADTAPEPRVARLAKETDAFLCEATLGPQAREHGPRGHSSAREAGAMARDGRVKRLVLTHYGVEAGANELTDEARAVFGGEIVVADDNTRLSVF